MIKLVPTRFTMLSISTDLLETIGVSEDTVVDIYADDGRIIIEPVFDEESCEDDDYCNGFCEFCPFAEECEEGEVD